MPGLASHQIKVIARERAVDRGEYSGEYSATFLASTVCLPPSLQEDSRSTSDGAVNPSSVLQQRSWWRTRTTLSRRRQNAKSEHAQLVFAKSCPHHAYWMLGRRPRRRRRARATVRHSSPVHPRSVSTWPRRRFDHGRLMRNFRSVSTTKQCAKESRPSS